ncbi:putative pectinesterase 11 [Zea mays]|uniref:Pectinesterase n=1 Tax=Zea mays TaxID=4577 RepID=B4FCJ7_MAIZE|nr:putative pectinesterase 11 [Zea mays]ACF79840.1 unknown [Zea mays]|eukprot:XP_023157068.1 putative pectinesterase 11 [Zea mays]
MPAGRSAPARGAAVAAMLLLTMLARLPCLEAQSSRRPTVLTVDMTGKGDYRTIQEAIDAIPAAANNSTSAAIVTINVNPGIYTEKVVVNKAGVSLVGRSATSTIVTWSGPWNQNHQSEFALYVQATDFVAKGLTFQNTLGSKDNGPAVAAKVDADKAAFYDCRFLSYQDTLLDATGRHYYRGCYIEGATDFIFGTGKAFFESCHLHSTSDAKGAFTAQRRSTESENAGFSFFRCESTGTGVATAILGRPWGPYARVVFALCNMSNTVAPEGWNNWDNTANEKTAFFGQFQCYGQGSGTQGRVTWAHNNLSPNEAAPFLTNAWVDGQDWLRPQ